MKLKTMSAWEYRRCKFSFGAKMRLGLYEKIASYLGTGVDLDNAMEEMAEAYVHFNKSDVRAKILRELRASLADGMSFANAMAVWAPPAEVMLIKSGEVNGDLGSAMANATLATQATNRMISAMVSQLSYPFLLLIILLVMMYVFSVQAVPQLAEAMDPSTWPALSMGLYYISEAVNHYWIHALVALGILSAVIKKTLPGSTGPLRAKLDRFPPYSLYKSYHGSLFLVSLSALMGTGIDVYKALDELKSLSSGYLKSHINKMQSKLLSGGNIGQALETNLLDKETAIDMRVYGSKPDVEQKMAIIGKNAIENGVKRIEIIGGLLKSLMFMAVGSYIIYTLIAFTVLTQAMRQSQM
jgi:type II secretory pathway component PulF